MHVRKLIVASLLSFGVGAAFAQAPGSALSAEEKEKLCKANPEKCAQIKENVQKRREEFQKKCEADPKACEEKKAQVKERVEQRREKRQERQEAMKERHGKMHERMQNAPRPSGK